MVSGSVTSGRQRHATLRIPAARARSGKAPRAAAPRDSAARAGSGCARLSSRSLEAGAEPAPVDGEVVDRPQREHDVDDDEPAIDAPGVRLDLAAGEVVDRPALVLGPALALGLRRRHPQPPRAAPGAWRPPRCSARRWRRPT